MQSRRRHSVTEPHTRWRICVTMATLWQQQDGGYMLFYIFNSTVVDWTIFFCCPTSVIILWRICAYIHISDRVETVRVYELPLIRNNTASETFFTQIGSGAKCWLNICHWGAGLAVNGRIRDNGQNVLVSFKQKVVAAPVTSTFSSLSHSSKRPLFEIR